MDSNDRESKSYHSWELQPDGTAVKKTDKSVFLHHGTAIPKEMYEHFGVSGMVEGERRSVTLTHTSGSYSADFTCTNDRVRLFWKQDFTNLIHTTFPDKFTSYQQGHEIIDSPLLRFKSLRPDNTEYSVEFLEPEEVSTVKKQRNPRWTRDELILALDLYFREPSAYGNAVHPAVIDLSSILNSLPIHKGRKVNEKYRNPNGVGMKLANFRALDPEYDNIGLSSSSILDREVWNDFSNDRERLKAVAEAIIGNFEQITSADDLGDEDEVEATEGRILTRIHQKRERNAGLVRKKKDQILKKTGKLQCEACGFDFYQVYGDHGYGFIECHHKKPVSEIKHGEKTKLSDLAVICANCHRMIHKSRPWLSLSEIQSILTT